MEVIKEHQLEIQNLKCGGCANTIKTELTGIEGVSEVTVDDTQGTVSFQADDSIISSVKERLNSLGYPVVGEDNSLFKKANSYVSCVKGRMQ